MKITLELDPKYLVALAALLDESRLSTDPEDDGRSDVWFMREHKLTVDEYVQAGIQRDSLIDQLRSADNQTNSK